MTEALLSNAATPVDALEQEKLAELEGTPPEAEIEEAVENTEEEGGEGSLLADKAAEANSDPVEEVIEPFESAPFSDLSIEIDSTSPPEDPTELFAPGTVDVTITNEGDKTVGGLVDLNLFVSSDKKINTRILPLTGKEVQDGLIASMEGVDLGGLEPGDSVSATIEYENVTSFLPPGSQFLIAEIDGESLGEGQDLVESNNLDPELVSLPGTDEIGRAHV